MSVYFECPLCGAEGSASVVPGEPAHGPTYDCGGYPGSDPSIEDVEMECECAQSPLVNEGAYWDECEKRAFAALDSMEVGR
jgi:hypothetical protein